jgi:formyltetrahydrofolate deformylase
MDTSISIVESPSMSAYPNRADSNKVGAYILTLQCKDAIGIVAAVSNFLALAGFNIRRSYQFEDEATGQFFMRTTVDPVGKGLTKAELEAGFRPTAERFQMTWHLHDPARKCRVLPLVSRFGHCLNDLLYRWRSDLLPIEIPAIISNHTDFEEQARWHGLPYHHLPVGPKGAAPTKAEQEAELLRLIDEYQIDLVVLARYMQVLSPELCRALAGRCINIHHSFLPSFKGAKPYQQAFDRGVKLIGATAHYVTADLDEGPIIEQAVERVDHTITSDQMVAIGRDIESMVLARAVQFHAEHRVLINGHKTVVFW